MNASLHVIPTDSVEGVTNRLGRPSAGTAGTNAYALVGLLGALAPNEIELSTSGDAVEAVWFYLDVNCDMKLRALSSVSPAPEWAALGYRWVYSVPYAKACEMVEWLNHMTIEPDQMRWLLSEMHESDGEYDPEQVRRAYEDLRRGLTKVSAGRIAILWLRKD
jgi:hypothetical protein